MAQELELTIRRATPGDAGRIGAIYDEGIGSGVATFAVGPHDAQERTRWLAARGPRAPVFVADGRDGVIAWSALAPFSGREWYEGVGEYTAYVGGSARGRGVGSLLLEHLISVAPDFGYWKLVGMILPENAAGLALAARAGFRTVGTYEAHGRIGGRWRDVVLLERHLERDA